MRARAEKNKPHGRAAAQDVRARVVAADARTAGEEMSRFRGREEEGARGGAGGGCRVGADFEA